MPDNFFGDHIREAKAMLKDMPTNRKPTAPRPLISVSAAARNLLAKLDTESSRTPAWEYDVEIEDLRASLAAEDETIRNFRKQFTQSGSTTSDPNLKYEIWN